MDRRNYLTSGADGGQGFTIGGSLVKRLFLYSEQTEKKQEKISSFLHETRRFFILFKDFLFILPRSEFFVQFIGCLFEVGTVDAVIRFDGRGDVLMPE